LRGERSGGNDEDEDEDEDDDDDDDDDEPGMVAASLDGVPGKALGTRRPPQSRLRPAGRPVTWPRHDE
jgi:hypothetical protein